MDTVQCTFYVFPLLPFELRARIWQFTVEPRTIEVRVDRRYSDEESYVRLTSSTPVPPTLHACRKARNLKFYERAFSEIGADGRHVWVSWDMDIVSIGTSYFDYFHPSAPLIQRFKDLDAFVNVKEIFVCADGVRAWHGAIEEHYPYWRCGEENLYLIDLADGGRMLKATELDAEMDQELREVWAEQGFHYPSGAPLSEELESVTR